MSALVLAALLAAAPEELTGRYRAITLGPAERRELHAAGLERVTGSSGRCLEEGMAPDSVETMFVEAKCAGVRTSIAWLKGNKRIHVLVCAEDQARSKAAVKLRERAQRELKGQPSVTACVRGDEVHLLGWAATASEREKLGAAAKRLGLVDEVEVLGEAEPLD